MARQIHSGSGQSTQTPLQQVTQFFLTAPIAQAVAASEIAAVILATRIGQADGPTEMAADPPTAAGIAQAILDTPLAPIDASGRVVRQRGRPRKGLPHDAHVLAGMAVPAAGTAPELPDQGSLGDDEA